MARKKTLFRSIRFIIEWIFLVPVIQTCRILPRSLAIFMLRPAVFLTWLLDGKHRRSTLDNVRLAYPDYTPDQVHSLAYKSYLNMSRLIVDFITMDRITKDNVDARCKYENIERLEQLIAEGNGVIIITGHIGLWELNAHLCHMRCPPMTTIGRPMDNPYLHRYVFKQRQLSGLTCLDKFDSLFPMFEILKNGGSVGVAVDQDGGRKGEFVKFFGKLCSTFNTLAKLSLHTGAPMLMVYGYYEPDGYQYTLHVGEKIELPEPSGNDDVDLMRLLQVQNDVIEEAIREHPEQWLWMHRRFRREPVDGCWVLKDDGSVVVQQGDDRIPLDQYKAEKKSKPED